MQRNFVTGIGAAVAAAGFYAAGCVSDDPAVPILIHDEASVQTMPDGASMPATDAGGAIDAGVTPDGSMPVDAGIDTGAPLLVDGGLVFALHIPQNLGSPPFAALAFDKTGHTIVGMSFNTSTSLGDASMSPPGGGGHDVGVVKLDVSGNAIWMQSFGGSGDDTVGAVAADANGDVYIAGEFNSATLGGTTLVHRGNGQYDAFLVKLSGADGSVLDAVDMVATTGNGGCNALAASATVVALGCTIAGNASARDATGTEVNVAPVGTLNDAFVFALDPTNLRQKWNLPVGGTDQDFLQGIALGPTGDVYIAGWFLSPTLNAAGGAVSIPRKTGGGFPTDGFAMRIPAAGGIPLWVKTYGTDDDSGTDALRPSGIAVAPSGDAFITGTLNGTVPCGSVPLTSQGGSDMFIAKLRGAEITPADGTGGNTLWARSYGGAKGDVAIGAAPDLVGGVFVGGNYFSTGMMFDTFSLPDPIGVTQSSLFSVRFGPDGGALWAHGVATTTSSSYSQASATASDPSSGTVAFAGTFQGFANLGDSKTAESFLDGGGYDLFVVKRAP